MTIPTDTDIVDIGLNRLASQFQEKPNIEGFLTSFLEACDELEDLFFQLLNERGIDTAIGNQLDDIGLIVNEGRLGRDDDTYRQALYLKIFINNSEGTPEDVMACLKIITMATHVNMWEHFPASVHMVTNGSMLSTNIVETISQVLPAGVSEVRVIHDPNDIAFTPNDLATEVFELATGDGDTIVTGDGDVVVVKNAVNIGATELAILAEVDLSGNILSGYESTGICAEIYV